jgi:ATP-dependent RNA helicase DeaD
MNKFKELGLTENICEGLESLGINEPTSIQGEVIPIALRNLDVVGRSVTGSGKTFAYLLPIFQKIEAGSRVMQAIIMAPTHELALQINTQVQLLAKSTDIPVTSGVIIGEVNIKRQVEKLRDKPNIIVGSPGRILELIKMKKISAHTIKTIVIDEGDRLLEDKNLETVKSVIKTTLKERQIMVFSATMSENAILKAVDLMKENEVVKIDESSVNEDIEHVAVLVPHRKKTEILRKLVNILDPERTIAFINRNELIQDVTDALNFHKMKSSAIFGNAIKKDRQKAMSEFKSGKVKILVASDLVARGMDINDMNLVFCLDVPEDVDGYLHRTGRVGRAGKKGIAISLVTESELKALRKVENKLGIKVNIKELREGKLVMSDEQIIRP